MKHEERERLHSAGGPKPSPRTIRHTFFGAKLFGGQIEVAFHSEDASVREINHAIRAMAQGLKQSGFSLDGYHATGGTIRKGTPILDEENRDDFLPLDKTILDGLREKYRLAGERHTPPTNQHEVETCRGCGRSRAFCLDGVCVDCRH
jgi:hypothetical protein